MGPGEERQQKDPGGAGRQRGPESSARLCRGRTLSCSPRSSWRLMMNLAPGRPGGGSKGSSWPGDDLRLARREGRGWRGPGHPAVVWGSRPTGTAKDLGALVWLGGPAGAPAEEGDVAADGADNGPLDLAVTRVDRRYLTRQSWQGTWPQLRASDWRPAALGTSHSTRGALAARAVLALALQTWPSKRAGGPGCGREGLRISAHLAWFLPAPCCLSCRSS